MPTMTLSAKKCVNCHKDVTNGQRMKDSSGRYWCVKCGTADQQKKAATSLRKLAKSVELPKTHIVTAGGGVDKGRLVKMLIVMALLVAGAVWRFSTLR